MTTTIHLCQIGHATKCYRWFGAFFSLILLLALPLTAHANTIAAGGSHTVAIRSDGTVWAWGDNQDGQLGNGTTTISPVPVQVLGLTDVIAVATGYEHTLALKSDGTVWTWGLNNLGQLGDGSITTRLVPQKVVGLSGVIAIDAGLHSSFALKSDGTLWAWGDNSVGQLGDGSTTGRYLPVPVPGLTAVKAVSAGESHTLALTNDGMVWAWGVNNFGQLGDGTTIGTLSPVLATVISGVSAIAAGQYHSVALKNDGTVWAWGYNFYGQLGNNNTVNSLFAQQALGLTGVTAIKAGFDSTVALKSDGTLWGWGYNGSGQLGNNTTASSPIPVQAIGISGVTAIDIDVYAYHTIVMKGDGTAWCMGYNNSGQLGNNSYSNSWVPVPVTAITQLRASNDRRTSISAITHTMAIKGDGTVLAWGENYYGQLGDGSTSSYTPYPVHAYNLFDINAVAAGTGFSLALMNNGSVWAWGDNYYGSLGNDPISYPTSPIPIMVSGLPLIKSVAAGASFSIALKSDGTVWSWGDNTNGKLGNNTIGGMQFTPVQVVGPGGIGFLTNITAIAVKGQHVLALRDDGTVWSWGYNAYGQLGNGSLTLSSSPVQVLGPGGLSVLTGVVAISSGTHFSVALKADGTVWSWGYNFEGELGNGTTTNSLFPVQVTGLSNIKAIAGGCSHSTALGSDGTIWAWGDNTNGELGNNTTTPSLTPVQVLGVGGTGLLTGAVAIAAGNYFTAALMDDSSIKTWGNNNNGQLGDGTVTGRLTPAMSLFNTYNLAVNFSGSGSGSVASSPAGISCNGNCSANYAAGALVNLSATPQVGSYFVGWSGACSGSGSCQVTMNAANSVTAVFDPIVNGTCGSANGLSSPVIPAVNLCSAGTPTFVSGAGSFTWSWSCTGQGGGTTATCSAPSTSPFNLTNALHFDGIDDYVDVSNQSAWYLSPAFTMETWINPDTTAGDMNLFQNYGCGIGCPTVSFTVGREMGCYAVGTPGKVNFFMTTDMGSFLVSQTSTLPASTWTHASVTYDGATLKLYINGVQEHSVPATGTPLIGSPGNIGADPYCGPRFQYKGKLKEFRLWNTPLSQAVLAARMNDPLAGTEPGLTAYYPFNQGVPGDNNSTETTLIDTKGGQNGLLYNFALTGNSSNWVTTFSEPLAGVCGSANGFYFSTAPTANLCATGIATPVTGSGPWSWSCKGFNGATTANCSATTPPQLSVTPISHDFTTVPVGGTASWPVTIANTGGATLNVSAITITGTDYSVDLTDSGSATQCGTSTPTIAPGSSCTVGVKLSPTFMGGKTATLAVTSDAPVSPSKTASFTGTGADPVPPTAALTYSPAGPYKAGTVVTITATFDKPMATTPAPQIALVGADSVGPFDMTMVTSTVYTYTYTAGSGNGTVTAGLSTGMAQGGVTVAGTPTSGASFTLDNTAPIAVISTPAPDPTTTSPITATVTFSEVVTGLTTAGVSVANGTLTNFAGSGTTYTFDVIPTAGGTVTVSVPAGVVFDAAGNTNAAAVPLTRSFDANAPVAYAPGTRMTLLFDGVDDYVSIPQSGQLEAGTGFTTFTIEAWINPVSLVPDAVPAYKAIAAAGGAWKFFLSEFNPSSWGLSVCTPGCTSAQTGPGGLLVNRWQHVAGTYDGSAIKIYKDGILVASTPQSGMTFSGADLIIGQWVTSFNGMIDEVRFWNTARTATEIRSTMYATLAGSEPGLQGYWRITEGAGTTIADSGPNNLPGTLAATPATPGWKPAGTWIPMNTDLTIQLDGMDLDGTPLTARITSLPPQGSLYQTPDGIARGPLISSVPTTVTNPGRQVIFVPALNGTGSPYSSFDYLVSDGILDSPPVSTSVTVADVTATISLGSLSQTYDGTAKTPTVATNPPGLTVTYSYTDALSNPVAAPVKAGTYTVTATVVDPVYAGSTTGTLIITPASLTVTATGIPKVYDGTPAASVSLTDNRISGDIFTVSGTALFADKNVGLSKPISVTGITLSGTDAGNYVVSTTAATTADITPALLYVTADPGSKTYGATDPVFTYTATGFQLTDTASILTGSPSRIAGENVGAYAISQGSLTAGANYTISFTGANLTVTPAFLTVTANAATKTYGATDPVLTYTVTGFQFSDTLAILTGTLARATGENVGSYAISQGSLTAGTNYTISVTGASLAISPATLTVTATTVSKIYGTTDPALTYTANGFKFSDTAALLTGTLSRPVGENVGSYAISLGTLSAGGNYAISFAGASLDITPRPLAVTASGATKIYDGTTAATITYSDNRISGDQITVSGTAAFADKQAGSGKPINITGITISGAAAGNYILTATTASTSAGITPRPLSVSGVTVASRSYDSTTSAVLSSGTLSGIFSPDVVTIGSVTGSFPDRNVGTNKPVTVTAITLAGADAANYSVTIPTGIAGDITPRVLAVSATGLNKVYDGTTAATATYSDDRISGDILTVSGSATFADRIVGTGKPVSVTGITITGSDAGNYTVATTSASTIADITPRPLTITATGVTKVYDGTTTATVTYSDNRIPGDSFTVSSTATFADKQAGSGRVINITGITISGADAGNYMLTATTASTSADITPRPLSVSANGVDKTYDGTTAAAVTYGDDRITGDTFSISGSALFADANVGTGKAVSVTAIALIGTDAGNYSLTTTAVATTATITAAPASIALSGLGQVYDGAPKPVSVTTIPSGLTTLITYDGNSAAPAGVGSYAVVATVSDPNYSGSAQGTLTINDTTPPSITAYSPGISSYAVPIDTAITVTFNKDLNSTAATDGNIVVRDSMGGAVPGTISFGANVATLTFAPASPLKYMAGYTVSLSSGITDRSGNQLIPVQWQFITATGPSDGNLTRDDDRNGITVSDALIALKMAVGQIVPTAEDLLHGDVAPIVNGVPAPDGKIDVGDAVVILRRVVGLLPPW